ncbi:cysteine-rich receptor-like protein kinase [Tanacetum coccineum]
MARHYKSLFFEGAATRPVFCCERLEKITMEEARLFEKEFNEKEIWETIMECEGDKAPGPDSFNFKFIKKYWDIIKADLVRVVMWFWENMEISRGCNASFVTIIPKVTDSIRLGDFRPISLIGCYYKIIAKMLTERVKRVVGNVVGDVQNAFIKGRYILDGILIANEAIELKKKREKGFGVKWCKWVEVCLRSSSMSILVNGSTTEEFGLERGVRQGDPLSPFLFILAAEGLNAVVKEAVESGIFRGVKLGANNVMVSHLQYTDDTILFVFLNVMKKRIVAG